MLAASKNQTNEFRETNFQVEQIPAETSWEEAWIPKEDSTPYVQEQAEWTWQGKSRSKRLEPLKEARDFMFFLK